MFGLPARDVTSRNKKVAVIELRGAIHDGDSGLLSNKKGISFMGEKDRLDKAFGTKGLAAIALIINCPGGSPAQSQLLGDYIRKLSDEKKVPVYAFVEDVAASGGYWLAAAAEEIYCIPTSQVGSIGIIANVMNYYELATKHGVKNVTVTAGESKSKLNPFQPVEDKDLAWLKEHATKLHEMFKDWVRERRGEKIVGAPVDLFDGNVWTGTEAKELGLVDGIGSYVDVMKTKIPKAKFIDIKPKKRGLFSSLLGAAHRPSPTDLIEDLAAKANILGIHLG